MSILKLNRLLNRQMNIYCSLTCSQQFSSLVSFKKNIIKLSASITPQRQSTNSFFFQSEEKKWQKFQQQEKEFGKLVYKSKLETNLIRSKALSLSSSVIGIAMMPSFMFALKEASLLAKILVFSTCSVCIFAVPILFQYALRRHVNRMHYNYETDTFTVFLYNFFLLEYKLQFKLSDINVPDIPGMFTSFNLTNANRSLFVDYGQVTDVKLVQKILGYDRPLDMHKYDKKNKNDDDDDD